MKRLRARLGASESGLTLIELIVAASMSVILVGAAGSMLISALRTQPDLSERSQSVSTARWVLERLTREIRNGVSVEEGATATAVSFVTKVRRTACGGAGALAADQPARECQVSYDCAVAAGTDRQGRPLYSCIRTEAEKGVLEGGATMPLITGISSSGVFNYSPNVEDPTYIGLTLRVPNPSGPGFLTISDGAGMRTPTLLG